MMTLLDPDLNSTNRAWTSRIRTWWNGHRPVIMPVSIAILSLFAIAKLATEFFRLLFETGRTGAIDLLIFQESVRLWFSGRPLYSEHSTALYPPASYAILWPLFGWGDAATLRWFWAITSIAVLILTIVILVKESGANTTAETILVSLLLLSMSATGVSVGNGQIPTHVLPILLLALVVLHRKKPSLLRDIGTAILLLIALAKPSISAPFVLLVLLGFGSWQVIAFLVVGYAALTGFAMSFQATVPSTLFREWMTRSFVESTKGVGYGNVTAWLTAPGLEDWILPVTLLVLVLFAVWLWRNQDVDFWILLGVTGIVARIWTHHRVYDDVLIILPMIALFRIAKAGPAKDPGDVVAGALLAVTAASMLIPATFLQQPFPWTKPFTVLHAMLWLSVLIFLIHQAWKERKAAQHSSTRIIEGVS